MEMTSPTTVIVRKNSFLSALATGVFGLLITVVIAVAALGLMAMHMADKNMAAVLPELRNGLANWRQILPHADVLNDRAAPEYRDQIKVDARLVPAGDRRRLPAVVVDVANSGAERVSLLTLRVTVLDPQNVPVREMTFQAATPIACGGEWIGPLLPAEAGRSPTMRRFARSVEGVDPGNKLEVEVVDVRVAQPPGASTIGNQPSADSKAELSPVAVRDSAPASGE